MKDIVGFFIFVLLPMIVVFVLCAGIVFFAKSTMFNQGGSSVIWEDDKQICVQTKQKKILGI